MKENLFSEVANTKGHLTRGSWGPTFVSYVNNLATEKRQNQQMERIKNNIVDISETPKHLKGTLPWFSNFMRL